MTKKAHQPWVGLLVLGLLLMLFAAAGQCEVGQGPTLNLSSAATQSFRLWLPVVSSGQGQLSSYWRSDAAILNVGSGTASAGLTFYPKGAVPITKNLILTAGKQIILRDIVGQTFNTLGKGPVLVTTNQPLVLTSRTYNDSATGTFGQDYDGFYEGATMISGQVAWIGHLTQKYPYRTNIGITNTSQSAVVAEITLYDGLGVTLKVYQVTIDPTSIWQSEAFKVELSRDDLEACYAKVEVKSGTGVMVHASVTDGRTNDPTTFWAKSTGEQYFTPPGDSNAPAFILSDELRWVNGSTSSSTALSHVNGEGILGRPADLSDDDDGYAFDYWYPVVSANSGQLSSFWRSDVGVLAAGTDAVDVRLKFYPSNAATVTKNLHLTAGQQVILRDVVGQSLATSGKGPLEVMANRPVLVTSRTYNDAPTGTFGQNYDGFDPSSGLVAGESTWVAMLTQKDPYRTNLGVTNAGTSPATVEVSLFDGNGSNLKTFQTTVNPGALWQNEVFKTQLGRNDLDSCYVKVKVLSGSGILVHGSVTDGRTNDPTTFWGKRALDQGSNAGRTQAMTAALTALAKVSQQVQLMLSQPSQVPVNKSSSEGAQVRGHCESVFKSWSENGVTIELNGVVCLSDYGIPVSCTATERITFDNYKADDAGTIIITSGGWTTQATSLVFPFNISGTTCGTIYYDYYEGTKVQHHKFSMYLTSMNEAVGGYVCFDTIFCFSIP